MIPTQTIILHHGIFAADELRLGPIRRNGWPGIPQALRAANHTVLTTKVHPSASIIKRAQQLKQQLLANSRFQDVIEPRRQEERLPDNDNRAILIAHSLGGLDARHMLTHLGMSAHIKTLITISTPHRGSSLAEFFRRNLNDRLRLYPLVHKLLDITAAHELTRDNIARFNDTTPNHPNVAYHSVTCAAPYPQVGLRYLNSHRIIQKEEGDNDGVVSVASATYANHLAHWTCGHVAAINISGIWGRIGPQIPQRYVDLVAAL